MKREVVLSKVLRDIQDAENYYKQEIEPKVLERYKIYNSDKEYYRTLFPKLSTRSSITSSDVQDTIEWAMPSLMRIFFGSDDVISIKGRTVEDDRQAEIMQELINFQIQRQNPGFMVFYNWFKDALITGLGIIKAYWTREIDTSEKVVVVSPDELEAARQDSRVEVVEAEELPNGLIKAKFKLKRIKTNQPVIENVPASEFIYNPLAKNIKDSPFVAHRKRVTASHLLSMAKAGVYDMEAVRRAIENQTEEKYDDSIDYYLHPERTQFDNNVDKARKEFVLYECYTKYDIDDNGILEDVIVTVVGNEVLRVEENIYGRPPFFVISPILEPYKIWGKGYADVLADIQALKTAMIRQLVVNTSLANDPKMFVNDEIVNIDDLIDDASFIRVNGSPAQAVVPYPFYPIAPQTFSFIEYIEGLKENKTGITRYNQGLDARSLNKTATGISLIMQAANQRLELIARIFAETGIKELFAFLVELNQRFIDNDTVVRLTNQNMIIRPDDLKGEFDLIVNAGVGVGTKETTLQNLQQLLGLLMQLTQIGLVTPENIYNVVKKYIETLGFKNVDDFITKPQEVPNAGTIPGQGGIRSQSGAGIPAGAEMQGSPEGLPGNAEQVQGTDIQRLAELVSRGMGQAEG